MNDVTTDDRAAAVPTDEAARVPLKRGRKSETTLERVARLKQALRDAEQAAKDADRRVHCIVGEALLAESADDPALKNRIADILRRRVITAQAKADIASLLIG